MSSLPLLLLFPLACTQAWSPPADPDLSVEAQAALRDSSAALARGDALAAAQHATRARRLDPASHLPLYARALAADSAGLHASAIAYYRACLAALPPGHGHAAKPILDRVAQVDQHALEQIHGIAALARQTADAIPASGWTAGAAHRERTLQALAALSDKLRSLPPLPPASSSSAFSASSAANPSRRGRPSSLAEAEILAWCALANTFSPLPAPAVTLAALAPEAPDAPEITIPFLVKLANSLADALAQTRTEELRWQQAWGLAAP